MYFVGFVALPTGVINHNTSPSKPASKPALNASAENPHPIHPRRKLAPSGPGKPPPSPCSDPSDGRGNCRSRAGFFDFLSNRIESKGGNRLPLPRHQKRPTPPLSGEGHERNACVANVKNPTPPPKGEKLHPSWGNPDSIQPWQTPTLSIPGMASSLFNHGEPALSPRLHVHFYCCRNDLTLFSSSLFRNRG